MNRNQAQRNIRNSNDLCAFVEELGYRDSGNHFAQLQLHNGAHASSLLNFFDDNPGAIEAIQEWLLNTSHVDEECEEVDEDDLEEEIPPTEKYTSTSSVESNS